MYANPADQCEWQFGEHPDLTSGSHVFGRKGVPCRVIPNEAGKAACQPAPAEGFDRRRILARIDFDRLSERCGSSCRPVGDAGGKAVQKHVDRAWLERFRRGKGRSGNVPRVEGRRQSTAEHCCAQGIEVRLSSQRTIEWFETVRRSEEQGRRVAPSIGREGDTGSEDLGLGPLVVVQGPSLCHVEQDDSIINGGRFVLRRGGDQGSAGTQRRTEGQGSRTFEECRCGSQTSPRLRSGSHLLKIGSDVLVGRDRRLAKMPRAPIGIDVGIGRVCESPMDSRPLILTRRSVDR